MASDYGLNFGFRRSDESMRIAEGRVKTPAAGAPLLLGTAVELDPANEGFLRVAAADAVPRPGICGLLVQEEVWDRSLYGQQELDSFSLGVAKRNRLSVITNGDGTKVWFRNTPAQSRADGRQIDAVTMVTGIATVTVGTRLGWDGTFWAAVSGAAGAPTNAFMEVTFVRPDDSFLEATLLR